MSSLAAVCTPCRGYKRWPRSDVADRDEQRRFHTRAKRQKRRAARRELRHVVEAWNAGCWESSGNDKTKGEKAEEEEYSDERLFRAAWGRVKSAAQGRVRQRAWDAWMAFTQGTSNRGARASTSGQQQGAQQQAQAEWWESGEDWDPAWARFWRDTGGRVPPGWQARWEWEEKQREEQRRRQWQQQQQQWQQRQQQRAASFEHGAQARVHLAALGLQPAAPLDGSVLRSAYMAAARRHHPDLHPPAGKAAAEERFKAAHAAYCFLMDRVKGR